MYGKGLLNTIETDVFMRRIEFVAYLSYNGSVPFRP